MSTAVITEIVSSGVGFAIPLVVAASGESISERAGVLNLSMEGMMLTGAFASILAAADTGSPVLGVFAGIIAATVFGLAQSLLSVRFRADQIVIGVAGNALALGLTTFGSRLLLSDGKGQSIGGFQSLDIPVLVDIPILGPALFGQTILGYLCIAFVLALAVTLSKRTVPGLTIDAIGEDAVSAEWTGLPVRRVRYLCVLLAAATGGLAGSQLALSEVHSFSDNMTGGLGYLAVVAVIAGRWRILGIVYACVFFGLAQALQYALPALGIDIPFALLVMLPYVFAIVAISGFIGGRRAPSCLTVPYTGR